MKQPEAEMLGSALKRRPKKVADTKLSTFDYGYHNPCTVLKNGECSIYAHRPLVCQIYFSVDTDALFCPAHSTANPRRFAESILRNSSRRITRFAAPPRQLTSANSLRDRNG
jgi:Fe-S-cluster containining protein